MDLIAGLLDGPRARGAFLLRSTMEPPWSVHIRDEAPLSLVSVVRGEAWILPEADEADGEVRLGPGDVAVLRGPDAYRVADDPATRPQMVILPGQVCVTADGQRIKPMRDLGMRTWGNNPNGRTVLLTGTYPEPGEVGQRLLRALPPLVVMPARACAGPVLSLLAEEIGQERPGQEAVLDRLLDVLLVAVLRAWFTRSEAQAPGWYRAHSDPIVGPALRALHDNPAHPWSVAGLAEVAGVSRATLARRFTELVGEPPMSYLTEWRITLASDLLREPGATLASVARRVGYATPFALSAAFKRVRGVSPRKSRAS